MILLKQVLHFTKVSRLLSKSNFLFSCMVQLTRNILRYSNLTLVRKPQLTKQGFLLGYLYRGFPQILIFFLLYMLVYLHFVVSNVIHHHNNDLFIWNSMTLQNLIGMANISLKQGKIIIILGIPSVIVLNGMQILLIVSQFIWLFAFFSNTHVNEFQLLQI